MHLYLHQNIYIKEGRTYEWYWAWRKLNSSLILSSVSAMVNFKGPPPEGGAYITQEKKINWISIIIIIRALLVSDGTTTHMKKKKGNNSLYYIIFLLFKVYVKKILICIKYNAGSYGVLLLTVQPSEQLNNREALELWTSKISHHHRHIEKQSSVSQPVI